MLKRTLAVALLALMPLAPPPEASANAFGHCAHERDVEKRVVACAKAARSTSYPWILHWVYRELARAHRERGEVKQAIASYARSLAAQERAAVRRELQELSQLSVTDPQPLMETRDARIELLPRH